ncbi:MAG: glycosyltransferase family 4 protein [Candidatus Aminicenantes bacterium]|nr:glycosyltransferase family 4 protein [Candidatus Aminicenantes bacterium]
MRFGFDVRPFLKEETGVGVYLRNLLEHLARIDDQNVYCLFSSSLRDRFPPAKLPPFKNLYFIDRKIPVRCLNYFWACFGWPPLDSFFSFFLDLTHSPSPLILPSRGKKIVTVHDLFALDYPNLAEAEAGWIFPKRVKSSLIQADGIITFSNFMYRDILNRFPYLRAEKIKVIPHGLDPFFLEIVSEQELKEFTLTHSLPSDFLLFVGTLEPRKNLVRFLRAFWEINRRWPSLHLILIGKKGQEEKDLRQLAKSLGIIDKVHFLGYLSRSEVRSFYHLAKALVLPSLCEGFGFPVIEAMACGLPVVISKSSALPEVGGDAALYFDPENTTEMIEAIAAVLTNKELALSLAEKGQERVRKFSWENAAQMTLNFYYDLIGARQ